jgi:hypothetical protein
MCFLRDTALQNSILPVSICCHLMMDESWTQKFNMELKSESAKWQEDERRFHIADRVL